MTLDVHALAPGDGLVTIQEAARALRVPARTVRSWVARGNLPATTWDGLQVVSLDQAADVEHASRTRPGRSRGRRRVAV